MSMFDASVRFIELCDPLTLFYSAWLSVDEKKEFQSLVISMLSKLKMESRLRVYGITLRLNNKRLTPAGRERKRSIVKQLFFNHNKCILKASTQAEDFSSSSVLAKAVKSLQLVS